MRLGVHIWAYWKGTFQLADHFPSKLSLNLLYSMPILALYFKLPDCGVEERFVSGDMNLNGCRQESRSVVGKRLTRGDCRADSLTAACPELAGPSLACRMSCLQALLPTSTESGGRLPSASSNGYNLRGNVKKCFKAGLQMQTFS